MTAGLKTKIGKGGRLVIPAAYRRGLHLKSGDEVLVCLQEGELRVLPLSLAIKRAQITVKKFNPDNKKLSDKLLTMRKEDAKHG